MDIHAIDREELAWAAGVVDGEGYISTVEHPLTHRHQLHMTVNQVDRRLCDRFQKAVGLGRVDGPYNYRQPNKQPVHRWQTGSFEETQAMLWFKLGPVKRAQASAALIRAIASKRIPRRKRGTGYQAMAKKGMQPTWES